MRDIKVNGEIAPKTKEKGPVFPRIAFSIQIKVNNRYMRKVDCYLHTTLGQALRMAIRGIRLDGKGSYDLSEAGPVKQVSSRFSANGGPVSLDSIPVAGAVYSVKVPLLRRMETVGKAKVGSTLAIR